MNRSKSDDGRDELDGIDLPSSAYQFGVDATGATHYHSAMARHVWVVEDGELTTEFDVADIEDYRAHVADTRGWDETIEYGGGIADVLVKAATEALDEPDAEEVSA